MAFVPEYPYDVFISYAWVCNYPQDDDDQYSGWVTRFRKRLQPRLDEKLKRIGASKFFFDQSSIGHNQDFNPQIEEALRKSATVVACFSEGYLASPGCRDEMRIFHELAGLNSGRLFLVRIEDVAPDSWPDEFHTYLKNIIGYDFFRKDPVKGIQFKLQPKDDEYEGVFEELRTGLAHQLKLMKEQPTPGVPPVKREPKPTVLVAQTTPDLRTQRKELAKYCASADLRVLPEQNWPATPDEFRAAFADAVQQSHLFVQLLSECYADRAPEFPDGIEAYQFQQARQAGLPILQWRDKQTDLQDVEDQTYPALVASPDVRTDLPAVFHQHVVDRTKRAFKIDQDTKHEAAGSGESKLVLVRANATDEEPTAVIVQSLSEANIRCRVSQNKVPMVERLREISFDALIVVLGNCPSDWRDDQGDELMAVDSNWKDQVPLRAYCHCGARKLPPYVGQGMIQIVTPDELDCLIQAIHQRGAAS